MAEHFIRATKVDPDQLLALDGTKALDRYAALRAGVSRHAPIAERLFAEPHIRDTAEGGLSISWYADTAGDATALTALDGGARASAEQALADQLAALRPLLDDPGIGRLLAQALYVNDLSDVIVVGDQPILTNWGTLPPGGLDSADQRRAHFAQTLGRFLPLASPPPLSEAEQSDWAQEAVSAPVPPAQPPVAPVIAPDVTSVAAVAVPDGPAHDRVRRGWIPLLVLLLLAGAIALWLWLPGTRLFPPDMIALGDDEAIAIAEDANATLEERATELRAAISGAQCRADGVLLLPDGRTPYGLLPPAEDATPDERSEFRSPGQTDSMLPPGPGRILMEGAPEAEAGSLLAALQAGTVMVVVNGPAGGQTGSGFFVDDRHIVTNHHVIDQAGAAPEIYVTSSALGGMRPARLLATSGPFQSTGDDFALLQIDEGSGIRPLALRKSARPLTLQNVVAAGYPGDVLMTDARFAQLSQGDPTAVPGLTVTDGIVNTEQNLPPDVQLVIHSAPISQGNSGGPLTDMCGGVVGLNTFVRTGELRNLNVALHTNDLISFLDEAGLDISAGSAECAPTVAARPLAAAATAEDASEPAEDAAE